MQNQLTQERERENVIGVMQMKIEQERQQLVSERMQQLEESCKQLLSDHAALQSERDELYIDKTIATETISALQHDLDDAERELENVKSHNLALQRRCAEMEKALRQIVQLEHTIPGKRIQHPVDIARDALASLAPAASSNKDYDGRHGLDHHGSGSLPSTEGGGR